MRIYRDTRKTELKRFWVIWILNRQQKQCWKHSLNFDVMLELDRRSWAEVHSYLIRCLLFAKYLWIMYLKNRKTLKRIQLRFPPFHDDNSFLFVCNEAKMRMAELECVPPVCNIRRIVNLTKTLFCTRLPRSRLLTPFWCARCNQWTIVNRFFELCLVHWLYFSLLNHRRHPMALTKPNIEFF